jgi:hypothetical protein
LEYNIKALKYNREISDRSAVARTLTQMGNIYFELHDFVASKSRTKKPQTAIETDDEITEVRIYLGLAELYKRFSDYHSTENYLNKVVLNAKKKCIQGTY